MSVVVYLDTWLLREAVSKDPGERRKASQLFARLESGVYSVIVPQVVVGEAVTTVMRDRDSSEWEETVGRIMRAIGKVADPATCFPPPEPAAAELAGRMMAGDRKMTRTDAFVAAQALLDPESQKVVTEDGILRRSAWVIEEENRMRRDGERTRRLKFDDYV